MGTRVGIGFAVALLAGCSEFSIFSLFHPEPAPEPAEEAQRDAPTSDAPVTSRPNGWDPPISELPSLPDRARGCTASWWYADLDADGFGDGSAPRWACTEKTGFVADSTDCDDQRADAFPGALERCDGIDHDCDGNVDEPDAVDASIWFADADGDTFGGTNSAPGCSAPTGFVADPGDCDEASPAVNPTAQERCNGIDDDCDGIADPDSSEDASTFYADHDGDGYGDVARPFLACAAPPDFVREADDCDDSTPFVHPGGSEHCNAVDDDCDGMIDEEAVDPPAWFADDDGDAFGGRDSVQACTPPLGYVGGSADCDDADPSIHPGAPEECRAFIDTNCDGRVGYTPPTDGSDPAETDVGSVHGRICAPSGHDVAGADVWAELADGSTVCARTAGDGTFTLNQVATGSETVQVEKGSFGIAFDVNVSPGVTTEASNQCFTADDVKIAVVQGVYDSIENVVGRLGFTSTLIASADAATFLRNPTVMAQYDIIFLNCGIDTSWWTHHAEVETNLRDFVNNGGSLYASDWSYLFVEQAYPDMIDFFGDDSKPYYAICTGMWTTPQTVDATVLDPAMAALLGATTAELDYDLDIWIGTAAPGTGTPLIQGDYAYLDIPAYDAGAPYEKVVTGAPLALRQTVGAGQVLYTTFHNQIQTTFDMDLLLEEIILSL